jgi:hypothetical protein
MDLDRLIKGQREFRAIVSSVVLLSELEAGLRKSFDDIMGAQELDLNVAMVLAAAQEFLVGADSARFAKEADYRAMLVDLLAAMRGTGVEAVHESDLECVRELWHNSVFVVFMATYDFAVHWKNTFVRGADLSNLFEAMPRASAFKDRIEALVAKMGKAWDLSDKVHADTYRLVLRQEAASYIRRGVENYKLKISDTNRQLQGTKDRLKELDSEVFELECTIESKTTKADVRAKCESDLGIAKSRRDHAADLVKGHEETLEVLKAKLDEWTAAVPVDAAA